MMPHSHCATGFRRVAAQTTTWCRPSRTRMGGSGLARPGCLAATRLNCFPWPLPAFSRIFHDHSLESDRPPTCIHPGCAGPLTCTPEPLARGHRSGRLASKRSETGCPEALPVVRKLLFSPSESRTTAEATGAGSFISASFPTTGRTVAALPGRYAKPGSAARMKHLPPIRTRNALASPE
jgi:hypothetical protein